MSDKMREAMIDQDGAVWEKIGGAWSLYRQAARRVPDGFVMVPVEPTPEMLEEIRWQEEVTNRALIVRYKALLSAAPEGKK